LAVTIQSCANLGGNRQFTACRARIGAVRLWFIGGDTWFFGTKHGLPQRFEEAIMASFPKISQLGLPAFSENDRILRRLAAVLLVSTTIFSLDILLELPGSIVAGEIHGPVQITHVVAEIAAVLMLGWGFQLTRRHILLLEDDRAAQHQQLRSLRGEFDIVLQARFRDWDLTEAEADIALLTLRGLKIADIASARNTREGTVKSQMSAVFRKAGVSTRGELYGLFMEEFLDHGAASSAGSAPGLHSGPATGSTPADLQTA